MAVAGIVNVLIYASLYRWIVTEEPLVPLIASIGLFVALSDAFRLTFGPYSRSFDPALSVPAFVPTFTAAQSVVLAVTVLLFLGLYVVVEYTRVGLAWQVTAQDRETAGIARNILTRWVYWI